MWYLTSMNLQKHLLMIHGVLLCYFRVVYRALEFHVENLEANSTIF
jgi:hypothetical protein